jgi:hypothetical protein
LRLGAAGNPTPYAAFAARQSAFGQAIEGHADRLLVEADIHEGSLSTAETKCAKWRLESVPVELREKGREALVFLSSAAGIEPCIA